MATLTFDEKAVFSIMARHKVPKAHAAAMVEAFHEVVVDTGELATKHDLKHELELLRRDTEITAYRTMLIGVGLITGIMAVMFNFFS